MHYEKLPWFFSSSILCEVWYLCLRGLALVQEEIWFIFFLIIFYLCLGGSLIRWIRFSLFFWALVLYFYSAMFKTLNIIANWILYQLFFCKYYIFLLIFLVLRWSYLFKISPKIIKKSQKKKIIFIFKLLFSIQYDFVSRLCLSKVH